MLSRVKKSPWLGLLPPLWGLVMLFLGVFFASPALLFACSVPGGIVFWLAMRTSPADPDPAKPKPALQVPAPFGTGPVDWNSLAALEFTMYGQRFPVRLYRERPTVYITSERKARGWITGQLDIGRPRDEMVFGSEPGIDIEDDEWWNLFRLPGCSAPGAGKPTSSSTERSSGAPSASTLPPAASDVRTFTAKDAAAIWPDTIIDGNEHQRAMPLREYARYFPNAVWTPREGIMRRLESHVGTRNRNLRLPDDAFPAKDEGDNTRSLFNRLLREAAQIGRMLESMERGGSCGTTMHAHAVREQRRIINQAKSLYLALADEDRKRGPVVLPEGAEFTPLKVETKMLPYSYRIPDSEGREPTSFEVDNAPDLHALIPLRYKTALTMSQRAVDAARAREFLYATDSYGPSPAQSEIYQKIVNGEL